MSSRSLDPGAIRAYAARDWSRVRDSKRAYWRTRLDRDGLGEALRITELLRGSGAPSEASREEDLETHRRVAEALAKTRPRPYRAGASGARRPR